MERVLMYTRFERFWHWSQTMLIMLLLVTGFEIHGTYTLTGFETAVDMHTIFAWCLIALWLLAIFWHLTTGEWRQYIPSSPDKIIVMVRYYMIGIFRGDDHPFHMSPKRKHNPLQRVAYLSLHLLITPTIWISGWAYLFYTSWSDWGLGGMSLLWVALIHTAAAFTMLAFLVAHLYFTITTSEEPFAFVKAMISGYEDKKVG
jgi:thiosulfate reductase cytochrome b subunit